MPTFLRLSDQRRGALTVASISQWPPVANPKLSTARASAAKPPPLLYSALGCKPVVEGAY